MREGMEYFIARGNVTIRGGKNWDFQLDLSGNFHPTHNASVTLGKSLNLPELVSLKMGLIKSTRQSCSE